MAAPMTKVLVVDDLEDNRTLLTRQLSRDGFIVEEAESGPEALAKISIGRYDVVLLDINMPGMGGVEVLRKIRSEPRNSKLPVMMLTASNQISDVLEARKSGATDYIMKPIDYPLALVRIKAALGGASRTAGL